MLGAIGFSVAAVAITAFAVSCQKTYHHVDRFRLGAFVSAFCLLAAAMVLWAIIAANNDPSMTAQLMVAADVLVLVASAAMVLVAVGRLVPLIIIPLGLIVALAVSYRVFNEPSTAYVQNGLLFFDLQDTMRLFVVGIFAFVWLPVAMYFAALVAHDPLLAKQRLTFQLYFVALVAVFGVFAKARREGAIIGLFAVMTALFIIMTVFNVVLARAHARLGKGVRHAAK